MKINMYAMVLIENDGHFLMVQENKAMKPWYLPAGRVEHGESFREAAIRETREEAGVDVELTGLIKVEAFPLSDDRHYMKVIFTGKTTKGFPRKDFEDEHSIQSAWMTTEEIQEVHLRSYEVIMYINHYLNGEVYPLEVLQDDRY